MHPHHAPKEDDLLDAVASWLERHAERSPSRDHGRFCRDAGDWVRAVQSEMAALRADFERGLDPTLIASQTADAMARLAPPPEMAPGGPDPASPKQDKMEPRPTEPERFGDPAPASHVERAGEIRSGVAEFRERLRMERAARAREAAASRRRFVESIRRRPAADEAKTEDPPPSEASGSPTAAPFDPLAFGPAGPESAEACASYWSLDPASFGHAAARGASAVSDVGPSSRPSDAGVCDAAHAGASVSDAPASAPNGDAGSDSAEPGACSLRGAAPSSPFHRVDGARCAQPESGGPASSPVAASHDSAGGPDTPIRFRRRDV